MYSLHHRIFFFMCVRVNPSIYAMYMYHTHAVTCSTLQEVCTVYNTYHTHMLYVNRRLAQAAMTHDKEKHVSMGSLHIFTHGPDTNLYRCSSSHVIPWHGCSSVMKDSIVKIPWCYIKIMTVGKASSLLSWLWLLLFVDLSTRNSAKEEVWMCSLSLDSCNLLKSFQMKHLFTRCNDSSS